MFFVNIIMHFSQSNLLNVLIVSIIYIKFYMTYFLSIKNVSEFENKAAFDSNLNNLRRDNIFITIREIILTRARSLLYEWERLYHVTERKSVLSG